jgi:IgA Peptidase M64
MFNKIHKIPKIITILFCILLSITTQIHAQENLFIEPTVEAKRSKLLDLIPEHNMIDSDRINLIFTPQDFKISNNQYIESILSDLIGWNGQKLSKDYGENLQISRGFFASDPIMNYKDKFNLYYIKDKSILNMSSSSSFGFQKEVLINILTTTNTLSDNSSADNGFNNLLKGIISSKIEFRFDLSYTSSFLNNQSVLAHELGHAIFGLFDEYLTRDPEYTTSDENEKRQNTIKSYEMIKNSANCANSIEEAQSKWGKYIGSLDPEFEDLKRSYSYLGSKHIDWNALSEKYTIKPTAHYCVTGLPDNRVKSALPNFKPSVYSLMSVSSDHTIWGSVNRAEVIRVLESVKGTGNPIPNNRKDFTQEEINYVKSQSYDDLEIRPRNKFGLNITRPSTIDIPKKSTFEEIMDQLTSNKDIVILLSIIVLLAIILKIIISRKSRKIK